VTRRRWLCRPTLRTATDGDLSKDGPLTPQPGAAVTVDEQDWRQVGGGGVGWLDAQRMVVVAQPGGMGVGMAIAGRPADAAELQAEVLGRRSESKEGLRAVGVMAAILALLLGASSTVWAVYKFKPGLVRNDPDVDVPVYKVDEFLDTYRPPTPPTMAVGPLSNGVESMMSSGRVNTPSQTALNAANWNNYISQLSSLFSTQLTATGSGVAGLIAGAITVTRGTQTELIGAGLGRQLPGNLIVVLVSL